MTLLLEILTAPWRYQLPFLLNFLLERPKWELDDFESGIQTIRIHCKEASGTALQRGYWQVARLVHFRKQHEKVGERDD